MNERGLTLVIFDLLERRWLYLRTFVELQTIMEESEALSKNVGFKINKNASKRCSNKKKRYDNRIEYSEE